MAATNIEDVTERSRHGSLSLRKDGGFIVYDCHAEVVARRALVKLVSFFMDPKYF